MIFAVEVIHFVSLANYPDLFLKTFCASITFSPHFHYLGKYDFCVSTFNKCCRFFGEKENLCEKPIQKQLVFITTTSIRNNIQYFFHSANIFNTVEETKKCKRYLSQACTSLTLTGHNFNILQVGLKLCKVIFLSSLSEQEIHHIVWCLYLQEF